jgi:arabinose-5-phosphate isomerase
MMILAEKTKEQVLVEGLFSEQQRLVNGFFDNLDVEAAERILKAFFYCTGTVIFTGIGKSSFVAKKIATTMASTGTKAFYLSAVNALHGDIGIVSEEDVFVVFSKSGESEELINLIPYVRNKGASIVGVSCNPQSRLAKASDIHIALSLEKELCPFDLAPTTSASIQLLFGDVLATGLMKMKGLSLDQYADNHPAGRIGKRICMRVEDFMLKGDKIPFCRDGDKLIEVLVELSDKRCGCLIVMDENKKMVGIFTDGDLRRALQRKGAGVLNERISDIMTKDPKRISPQKLAFDAMQYMEEDQKRPITVLPVLDGDAVVGVIKMHDLLQAGI